MLCMYAPVSDLKRSMTEGAIGAPPLYTLRKEEKFLPAAVGSLISAINTVIAPTVNVGLCFSVHSVRLMTDW